MSPIKVILDETHFINTNHGEPKENSYREFGNKTLGMLKNAKIKGLCAIKVNLAFSWMRN